MPEHTSTEPTDHTVISQSQSQETRSAIETPSTVTPVNTSLIMISELSMRIEQLFKSIEDIHKKVDRLQQEKEAPTGCGFSCTNNSLNM